MKSSPPLDVLVVGGGSAGHAAATQSASAGLTCALVESAPELGGLCILRGCMPSKTLIETANRMRDIREAKTFGISVRAPELDLDCLKSRLDDLLRDFQSARVSAMQSGRYQLIRGRVRFTSPTEVEIILPDGTATRRQATAFIIATGSKPHIPELPGLEGTPYWTSDDAVKLPHLPKHVAIVGAGSIGMEFAHLFEGFGCSVTVIARSHCIFEGHDPDLSKALEHASRRRGIELHLGTDVRSVNYDHGFTLELSSAKPVRADTLLIATGRVPNTDGLGLQEIGIAMDKRRIITDERSATSLRHIFAAGDCTSPVSVVHLAVAQGEVAARNACRLIREGHATSPAEWNRDSAMAAWFTTPECVEIGTSEATASDHGIRCVTGFQSYREHGKGMIVGAREGFLKVIVEVDSGTIVGAVGVGPHVADTGNLLQSAIDQRLTAEAYSRLPHYHPTLAEAWSRAAADAEAKRKALTELNP